MNENTLDTEIAKIVLEERARKFAHKKDKTFIASEQSRLLIFTLGNNKKYAMDLSLIERVIPKQPITAVPGLKPCFAGLIYHNSEIWPVIALKVVFHCHNDDTDNHIILLYEGAFKYALLVGDIIGQKTYDKAKELSYIMKDNTKDLVFGIFNEDVAVIDVQALLNILKTTSIT